MSAAAFFKTTHMTVRVAPTSPAHATVFWCLTGINPYRFITGIKGKLTWSLPEPLHHWSGTTNFDRKSGFHWE